MRVALLTTFVASRKEPLAEMLQRIYQAFSGAGLGEPAIRFNFGDTQLPGSVSSVDRVLKRHPELARFVTYCCAYATHSGSTADYQRSSFAGSGRGRALRDAPRDCRRRSQIFPVPRHRHSLSLARVRRVDPHVQRNRRK